MPKGSKCLTLRRCCSPAMLPRFNVQETRSKQPYAINHFIFQNLLKKRAHCHCVCVFVFSFFISPSFVSFIFFHLFSPLIYLKGFFHLHLSAKIHTVLQLIAFDFLYIFWNKCYKVLHTNCHTHTQTPHTQTHTNTRHFDDSLNPCSRDVKCMIKQTISNNPME